MSGLAVVSTSTHPTLLANLSASDLRCLAPGLFSSLLLPLEEFLEQRPLLAAVQLETAQVREYQEETLIEINNDRDLEKSV